ncbi:MAG: hypothetical protein EP343_21370 [Deltaproteobacteria bacterium]|nr:MAG: hypothetical protein EP343_21370 [Deltaproteobacteria bacterium]
MTSSNKNDKSSNKEDPPASTPSKKSPSNDLLAGFDLSLDDLLDQGISSLTPSTPVTPAPFLQPPQEAASSQELDADKAPQDEEKQEPQQPVSIETESQQEQEPPKEETVAATPSSETTVVGGTPPPAQDNPPPAPPREVTPLPQPPEVSHTPALPFSAAVVTTSPTPAPPTPAPLPVPPMQESEAFPPKAPVGMTTIALSQEDILLEPPISQHTSPLMTTIHLGPDDILAQESGDEVPVPPEIQSLTPTTSTSLDSKPETPAPDEAPQSSEETSAVPPQEETTTAGGKPPSLEATPSQEQQEAPPPRGTLPFTAGVQASEPELPQSTPEPSANDNTPQETTSAQSEAALDESPSTSENPSPPTAPQIEVPAVEDVADPSKATQQVKLSDVEVFVARGRGSSEELPVIDPGSTQSVMHSAIQAKVVRGRGSSSELLMESPSLTQPVSRADINVAAQSEASAVVEQGAEASATSHEPTLQKTQPPVVEEATLQKAQPPSLEDSASTLQVRQEDIQAAVQQQTGTPPTGTPPPVSASSKSTGDWGNPTPTRGRSPQSTLQLPRDEVLAIAQAREDGQIPDDVESDKLPRKPTQQSPHTTPHTLDATEAIQDQAPKTGNPDLFATQMDPYTIAHESSPSESATSIIDDTNISLFQKGPEAIGAFMATTHDTDAIGTEALDLFEVGDSYGGSPSTTSTGEQQPVKTEPSPPQEPTSGEEKMLFPALDPSQEIPLDSVMSLPSESPATPAPISASSGPVIATPKEPTVRTPQSRSMQLSRSEAPEVTNSVKQTLDRPLRNPTKENGKPTNLLIFAIGLLLMMSLLTIAGVWFFVFR